MLSQIIVCRRKCVKIYISDAWLLFFSSECTFVGYDVFAFYPVKCKIWCFVPFLLIISLTLRAELVKTCFSHFLKQSKNISILKTHIFQRYFIAKNTFNDEVASKTLFWKMPHTFYFYSFKFTSESLHKCVNTRCSMHLSQKVHTCPYNRYTISNLLTKLFHSYHFMVYNTDAHVIKLRYA